jgi:hypothetical protein
LGWQSRAARDFSANPSYPFGESHTFAGVDCVIDWMHEQDIIPVRASYWSPAQPRRGGRTCGSV